MSKDIDLDRAVASARRALRAMTTSEPGTGKPGGPTATPTAPTEQPAAPPPTGGPAARDCGGGPQVDGKRQCAVEGCVKPHAARGWCQTHYRTQRRKVDPAYDAAQRERVRDKDHRLRARRQAEAAAYRAMRERGILP